jgi:hypothetical protein
LVPSGQILRCAQDDRAGAQDDRAGAQVDRAGAQVDRAGAQDDMAGAQVDIGIAHILDNAYARCARRRMGVGEILPPQSPNPAQEFAAL